MNQPRRRSIRLINLTSEARIWLGNLTRPMADTVRGSLCRAREDAPKLYRKSSRWLKARIGGTATINKPLETPLRLSPSSSSELETQPVEGLRWVLIPIRQTVQAPSDQPSDPDERPPMPFPQDFEWPTPPYIKCSDLAKCGYPHIYTILERGLEAIGWTYNINTGRWYPPPSIPEDQQEKADGEDYLKRAKGTALEGLRPAGERERARRQRTGGLSNRYS